MATADGLKPLVRTRLTTRDEDAARGFLDEVYGSSLRLSGGMDGSPLRYVRTEAGQFSSDEVGFPTEVSFSCDPIDRLVAAVVDDGLMEVTAERTTDRTGPGEVGLLRPHVPFAARQDRTKMRIITLDPEVLRQVSGVPLDEPVPEPHFESARPLDAAAADLWRTTARFAADRLAGANALSPLVLGNTSRLLAQVALAVFPNTTTAAPARPADTADATPATVRRAVAFIEANADQDIGVAQIAAAAFVTPRAVQYAFRHHLDTTPLAHLRRVRLDGAHRDLLTADPAATSVTEIAYRWGFTHLGHFTRHYRTVYRTTPSTSLNTRPGSLTPAKA